MTRALPVLLPILALFACSASDRDPPGDSATSTGSTTTGSPATGTPTTTTTTPPTPSWAGPATAVDPGSLTHHAALALTPDGTAWIAYQSGNTVRIRVLDSDLLVHDSAPAEFDHPAIAAAGDRIVGLSTLSTGGLNGVAWATDGAVSGGPEWLPTTVGGFPDLGLSQTDGIAAWSEGDGVGCALLGQQLDSATLLPCPTPGDPALGVGTLAVDYGDGGGWLAWSEAATGTPATVHISPIGPGGALFGEAVAVAVHDSWDARPDVVRTETGGLVAWRGADGPVLPSQVRVAAFTAADAVSEPVLVATDADRPALAHHGGLALLAWDQPDGIWVVALNPATGQLLGEPFEATESDEPAARPAVAIRADGAGWQATLAWEATTGPGPLTEVRVRTLTLE